MTEIEIYSTALCPFAHRVRLTLQEKRIPFKLIEIDLHNKPRNFSEISPYGKVPVLSPFPFTPPGLIPSINSSSPPKDLQQPLIERVIRGDRPYKYCPEPTAIYYAPMYLMSIEYLNYKHFLDTNITFT